VRRYHSRIEVQRPDGTHLYRTTAQVAEFLMAEGRAEIAQQNGRVRSVRLTATAETHAQRVGEAQATLPLNTKFTRRVKTDSGCTWIEHHPRSLERRE
jgi:hypothetical protein